MAGNLSAILKMAAQNKKRGKKKLVKRNHNGYHRNRGRSKKKRTYFPKGQQSCTDRLVYLNSTAHRPTVRHDEDYFNQVAPETKKGELSSPGIKGTIGRAINLRPKRRKATDVTSRHKPEDSDGIGQYEVDNDNILVHKNSLMKLITEYIKSHGEQEDVCDELDLDMIEFQPWGFFSSVKVWCKTCKLKSPRTQLYEEIPSEGPGRKAAAANMRLLILLNFLPIGPTALQLICAALGIKPCSMKGMQKLADRAGEFIKDAANKDMRKWRQHVMNILHNRGIDEHNIFSGSIDTTYHGSSKASSVTPGTGASQATAICMENVSGQHKIVGHVHVNQVCIYMHLFFNLNSEHHIHCITMIKPTGVG